MSEDIKYSCLEHGWLDLDGLCEQCLLREAKRMTADTKRPRELDLKSADEILHQYTLPDTTEFIDQGNLFFAATEYKSAYDALKKDYLESSGAMNKEIAELEAELAACKASMSAHDKSRAKVLLKVAELEAERERLQAIADQRRTDRVALEKQVAELKDAVEFQANYAEKWRKKRDALQSEVAELNNNSVRLQDRFMREEEAKIALQSRLAECEKKLERTTVPDLIKIGEDLREKLAAAEAVRERLERKLGAADKEHAELLQWCERLAAKANEILNNPRYSSVLALAVWEPTKAEFEAWKKERGV